jgi:predicted methyltransferase MtxX (methanogen marker protein 4)
VLAQEPVRVQELVQEQEQELVRVQEPERALVQEQGLELELERAREPVRALAQELVRVPELVRELEAPTPGQAPAAATTRRLSKKVTAHGRSTLRRTTQETHHIHSMRS